MFSLLKRIIFSIHIEVYNCGLWSAGWKNGWCWCWCWCWFVVREKYCYFAEKIWLISSNEEGVTLGLFFWIRSVMFIGIRMSNIQHTVHACMFGTEVIYGFAFRVTFICSSCWTNHETFFSCRLSTVYKTLHVQCIYENASQSREKKYIQQKPTRWHLSSANRGKNK